MISFKYNKENEKKSTTEHREQSNDQLQTEENKKPEESNKDVELDISSDTFNPLRALYAPDYRVTQKQPKIIYQNMAAFETALKKVGIWDLNKRSKVSQPSGSKDGNNKKQTLVEEQTTQRRFQEHQMAIKTQPKIKNKHHRNLLMQMAQAEGPLQQLFRYVKENKRVKVVVRREHGVKGYVEGKLKMFDRHWNLLLDDVEECLHHRKFKYVEEKVVTHQEPQDCSYYLQQLGIDLPSQHIKSLGRKSVEIKRYLPQLFLRGEHVVVVSSVNETPDPKIES